MVQEIVDRLLALGFVVEKEESAGSPRLTHERCPGRRFNQRDGSSYVEDHEGVGLTATGRHRAWFVDLAGNPGTVDRLGRYPKWSGQALVQLLRRLEAAVGR